MASLRKSARDLGQTLRTARQAYGLTQGQLAIRLGVTRQAISKWEHGQSQPDLSNLRQLAELYGCTVDELLGPSGHAPADAVLNDSVPVAQITPSEGARIMRDRALVWKHALASGCLLGAGLAAADTLGHAYDPETSPWLLFASCAVALFCAAKLFGYYAEFFQRGGTRLAPALTCALVAFASVMPLVFGASSAAMALCALAGFACIFCSNRIFAWRLLYQRAWDPREDFRDPWGHKNHA